MSLDKARITEQIVANYQGVRKRVAKAAARAGRDAGDITIVAITKYVDAEWVRPLYEAGCRDFGEARPQQLWDKVDSLGDLDDARWHMIGHLQRNKVGRTLKCADLIHSVDGTRLMRALDQQTDDGSRTNVLLEVNISGDVAKHGFSGDGLGDLLADASSFPHVEICGLMAMAGLSASESETRDQFQSLRELLHSVVNVAPDSNQRTQLSMGMSQDYEIAVEEGATIVRVGSALFAGCGLR